LLAGTTRRILASAQSPDWRSIDPWDPPILTFHAALATLLVVPVRSSRGRPWRL